MIGEVTPYKMAIWRHLCQRSLDEDRESLRPTIAPPPMCLQVKADLYRAQDELAAFAVKTKENS